MHLRNVDLYCEVVRCRSFSRAAEARSVSQPLVTQAVKALEDHLGTQLLNRSHRPFEVTPAGQAFFDECSDLLQRLHAIEDRVQRLGNRVTGRVRVAAIYSISYSEMEAYERQYKRLYPEASLTVESAHPEEVYRKVLADEVDLGIVSFPRGGGEFQSVPWQQQEMVAVLPPSHPKARRNSTDKGGSSAGDDGLSTLRVSDLAGERFVAFTGDLKIRREIDRWLKEARVDVEPIQQFDNVETIKSAVKDGVGVSILPLATVWKDVTAGLLAAARLADVTWRRPVGIVHRRNKSPATAAQRFIELLKKGPPESDASNHLPGDQPAVQAASSHVAGRHDAVRRFETTTAGAKPAEVKPGELKKPGVKSGAAKAAAKIPATKNAVDGGRSAVNVGASRGAASRGAASRETAAAASGGAARAGSGEAAPPRKKRRRVLSR